MFIALLSLASNFFCSSKFSKFKATKIAQIGFEMSKICFFEVKGVIFWFKQRQPN
jgi:hypothetical protein